METRSKSTAFIQNEVENLVAKIIGLGGHEKYTLDLQPLFFRLTLNTTMAFLFGKSMEDLEKQASISEATFARAFDHAQHRLAERGRLGDYYWLMGGRDFWKSCRLVHEFVDTVVSNALKEADEYRITIKQEQKSSLDQESDRYIFIRALISQTRDPIVLRDQMINLLLAGRDTTACLLSWTL